MDEDHHDYLGPDGDEVDPAKPAHGYRPAQGDKSGCVVAFVLAGVLFLVFFALFVYFGTMWH